MHTTHCFAFKIVFELLLKAISHNDLETKGATFRLPQNKMAFLKRETIFVSFPTVMTMKKLYEFINLFNLSVLCGGIVRP